MGQKENLEILLQIHSITTGTKKTVEEIVNQRKVEPDISLIANSEVGGKINFFGKKVSIDKYYTLGEHLERSTRASG